MTLRATRLTVFVLGVALLGQCTLGGLDFDLPRLPELPDVPLIGDGPEREPATVERVVDGDTLELVDGRTVRLIGIDTPETVHPSQPVECFGAEASAHLAELLPAGEPVLLEYDVELTDRYGRTLAYVHRARDGLHVNAAMVAEGYATVATYPPNVAHTDEFVRLQAEAAEAGKGLWGSCPVEPEG